MLVCERTALESVIGNGRALGEFQPADVCQLTAIPEGVFSDARDARSRLAAQRRAVAERT